MIVDEIVHGFVALCGALTAAMIMMAAIFYAVDRFAWMMEQLWVRYTMWRHIAPVIEEYVRHMEEHNPDDYKALRGKAARSCKRER